MGSPGGLSYLVSSGGWFPDGFGVPRMSHFEGHKMGRFGGQIQGSKIAHFGGPLFRGHITAIQA